MKFAAAWCAAWQEQRAGFRTQTRVGGIARSGSQLAQTTARQIGVNAIGKFGEKAADVFYIHRVLDVLPVHKLDFLCHRRRWNTSVGHQTRLDALPWSRSDQRFASHQRRCPGRAAARPKGRGLRQRHRINGFSAGRLQRRAEFER